MIAVIVMTASAAFGHAEVRFRAPEDNQVLGGTVDHVDIQYWTPVERATITLTGPDGAEVAVSETIVSGRGFRASIEFGALTKNGVYNVDHVELSEDQDEQVGQFQFTYDPASSERIGSLVDRDSGPNWLLLVGIAVIVGGVAALLVPKRRSTRRS